MLDPQRLGGIDANVQTLHALEGTLALPPLPEEVKLDLVAMPEASPVVLSSLMHGIDEDMRAAANRREPLPVREMELWTPQTSGLSVAERTARGMHMIASEQSYPFELDGRAVQRWKQRAVDGGYLDLSPRQIEDGSWLPEYRAVAAEMTNDAMRARFSGEKPGSISLAQMVDVAEQWLSPRGLYRAAMELDLWWDFEKIGDEYANWGNAVKEWTEDPWDIRKFLGMLGPVDDILMPALTWGLMFTGVGQVMVTGRALLGGARLGGAALKAVNTGGRLRRAWQSALMTTNPYDDIARFGGRVMPGASEGALTRQNFFQSRLLTPRTDIVGDEAATAIGRGLETFRQSSVAARANDAIGAWRANSGVIMAKKANQQAIRAGLAGNVRGLMGESGDYTVANLTTVDDYVNKVLENDLVDFAIDIFFTPPNFLEVGGWKAIGNAMKPDLVTRWASVTPNEEFTANVWTSFNHHFMAEQPARADLFQAITKEKGVESGLAYAMGLSIDGALDDTARATLNAQMSWVALNAATDAAAAQAVRSATAGVGDAFTGSELSRFNDVRARLHAQSAFYDEFDLDRVLDAYSGFSYPGADGKVQVLTELDALAAQWGGVADGTQDVVARGTRAQRIAARRQAMYEHLLADAWEESDYVRLYGARNEGGDVVWSTTAAHDSRYETMINIDEWAAANGMERAAAHEELLRRASTGEWADEDWRFINRYGEIVGEGKVPWRMVEPDNAGQMSLFRDPSSSRLRPFDPDRLADLRGAVQAHNEKAAAFRIDLMNSLTPEALRIYVGKNAASMGRFNDYMAASEELRTAIRSGQLDQAKFAKPRSESGRQISLKHVGEASHGDPAVAGARRIADDLPDGVIGPDAGVFSGGERVRDMTPAEIEYVRDLDADFRLSSAKDKWYDQFLTHRAPDMSNRVTLRYVGTEANPVPLTEISPIKEEAARIVHGAKRRRQLIEAWEAVEARSADKAKAIQKIEDAWAGDATADEIVEMLSGARLLVGGSSRELLRSLIIRARKDGMSFADVGNYLRREADTWLTETDFMRYNVDLVREGGASGLIERLDVVRKRVKEESNNFARGVEAPPELKRRLKELGYEVVYGDKFANPLEHQMEFFPDVAEVTRAHIAKVQAKSFFQRKDPYAQQALRGRLARSSLFSELKRLNPEGVHPGLPGVAQRMGDDFNSQQATQVIDNIMSDLWEIFESTTEEARTIAGAGSAWYQKYPARIQLSRHAGGLDGLPQALGRKRWNELMSQRGYSVAEASAIRSALMKSRDMGFSEMGLMSMEFWIRNNVNIQNGLRMLGRQTADSRTALGAHRLAKTAGAVVGGHLAQADYVERAEEPGIVGRSAAGIAGAALGAAGGAAVSMPVLRRLGTGIRHSNEGKFAKWAGEIERGEKWTTGYVMEELAQLRDQLRFTLSPIFDASRYSEAMILSVLEEVPEGLRNLRVNQSPTFYRKRIAQGLIKNEGLSPADARQAANAVWDQKMGEFRAAAKGQFDWDVIDGMDRRYESVGILGFSPQAWQASTFAQLMDAGVDAEKAFEITRSIYTYGTTGRSAAELSANYIFFPLSFTKKTLGHMKNFLTHDMGRTVVLQDMMYTYQTLSEHYDLEREFADRLPILNRAARLNLLAYGVGLGRFGGINAQMFSALGQVPVLRSAVAPNLGVGTTFGVDPSIDGITNLFLPQVVSTSSASQADDVWEVTREMLPALNDVIYLLQDLAMSGQVLANESWMTNRAEEQRAWEEWRAWQDEHMAALEAAGFTWEQAMRMPEFAAVAREARTEISRKYPAWKFSFGDGIAAQQAIDMEVAERVQAWERGESRSPVDGALAEFKLLFDMSGEEMSRFGYSWSTPEAVPPGVFTTMRDHAIRIYNQLETDYEKRAWLRLYGRTYRRILGDIMVEWV